LYYEPEDMMTQVLGTQTPVTEGTPGALLVPELQVPLDDGAIADWKESAADCVRTYLFPKKQFLATDAELDMGGSIQRHVTRHINLANDTKMRIFWDEKGGRETVRNTFRRKRQTAQNAMKLAFKGKIKLKWWNSKIVMLSHRV
jgi:hypothetical protein